MADRSASRLLHPRRDSGAHEDKRFLDLPDLLRQDDLLVVNNSRVFPARLFGHRWGKRAQPVSPRRQMPATFFDGSLALAASAATCCQVGFAGMVRPSAAKIFLLYMMKEDSP